MALTDAACKAAKAAGQKQELADGRGLALVVGTTGKKSWVLRYKDGKQSRRLTLGEFNPKSPEGMGLADARIAASQAKADLKAKREAESSAETAGARLTVSEAFAAYMRERWGSDSREDADKRKRARWSMFERHFEPVIGDRPLLELTKRELKTILRERRDAIINGGGTGRGIGNVQADFSAFLSWCADEGEDLTVLENNVLAGVRKVAKAAKRKRWLKDHEIVWLFKALPEARSFEKSFEWLLRIGQRRTESLTVLRRNIVLQSDFGPHLWLDRENTKNRKQHIVPLTDQMIALLPDLDKLAPDQRIWPNCAEGTSKAWDRVFTKVQELAVEEEWQEPVGRFSLHDFRRTCRTNMHRPEWRAVIAASDVGRCFNHGATDAIDDIYNQWDYISEKRGAFALWNDRLDRIAGR